MSVKERKKVVGGVGGVGVEGGQERAGGPPTGAHVDLGAAHAVVPGWAVVEALAVLPHALPPQEQEELGLAAHTAVVPGAHRAAFTHGVGSITSCKTHTHTHTHAHTHTRAHAQTHGGREEDETKKVREVSGVTDIVAKYHGAHQHEVLLNRSCKVGLYLSRPPTGPCECNKQATSGAVTG